MDIEKNMSALMALNDLRKQAIKLSAEKIGTKIMLVEAGKTLEEADEIVDRLFNTVGESARTKEEKIKGLIRDGKTADEIAELLERGILSNETK